MHDDWSWPGGPTLSLLHRRTARLPRRVAAFVEFVVEALAGFDPDSETFEAERRPPLAVRRSD